MQVRALLAKLQAVFDLPRRLRTAIDQGAIEIAVNSYADAAPLLKRYGHKVSHVLPICAAKHLGHPHLQSFCIELAHKPDVGVSHLHLQQDLSATSI